MVGKGVEHIEDITAYIKVHTKLWHSVMQILTELEEVYGYYYLMRQFVDGERNISRTQCPAKMQ